jgi:aspartyl-tRNA(Asn)/glutamyl-tRNA(Gln) amidotransferase subunit A
VVGFKPTYGRISRSGLVAFASSLDQIGPLARQVGDAALAYEVMAGRDARDATTAAEAVGDTVARLEDGPGNLRIGVLAEVPAESLQPGPRRAWEESLARLSRAGADLVEVSVPNLGAAIAAYYVIATSEASANLARFDGVRYGLREAGATLSRMYAATRGRGFGREVKRRIMLGTHALSAGYYDAYYERARRVAAALRRQFDAAFEKVDLIATPTAPTSAFRLGEKSGDPLAMYLSDIFTTPANLAGLPAIALPAGRDESGLPLSLQLMANRFEEATLLRAARAFERETAFLVEPDFHGALDAA